MPKYALLVKDALVKFTKGAGAAESFECQVTSAAIVAKPKLVTIPATGCEGETQQPAVTSYDLDLAFLQDWGQDPSLSQFLWDNDTEEAEFEISLGPDPIPLASGTVRCVAGSYGG